MNDCYIGGDETSLQEQCLRFRVVVESQESSMLQVGFQKEESSDSEEPRYKTQLIVKSFSQISKVDFTNVFSSVVKHNSIGVFPGIFAL